MKKKISLNRIIFKRKKQLNLVNKLKNWKEIIISKNVL